MLPAAKQALAWAWKQHARAGTVIAGAVMTLHMLGITHGPAEWKVWLIYVGTFGGYACVLEYLKGE